MFGFIKTIIAGAKMFGGKIVSMIAAANNSKTFWATVRNIGTGLGCICSAFTLVKQVQNEMRVHDAKKTSSKKASSATTAGKAAKVNASGKVVNKGNIAKKCKAPMPLAKELEDISEIYEDCTEQEREELQEINEKAREAGEPKVPAQDRALTKINEKKTVAQNLVTEMNAYKRLRDRLDKSTNDGEAYGMSPEEYYNSVMLPTQRFRVEAHRKLSGEIKKCNAYNKPAKGMTQTKWNDLAVKLHTALDTEVERKAATLKINNEGGTLDSPLEFGGICLPA